MPGWVHWLISQLYVFQQIRESIHTKASDAHPQPKAHHVMHGVNYLRVAPVEVRLLLEKLVVIVLSGGFIQSPCRAVRIHAEHGSPVVRRSAASLAFVPHVPIALGCTGAAARVLEPRVL